MLLWSLTHEQSDDWVISQMCPSLPKAFYLLFLEIKTSILFVSGIWISCIWIVFFWIVLYLLSQFSSPHSRLLAACHWTLLAQSYGQVIPGKTGSGHGKTIYLMLIILAPNVGNPAPDPGNWLWWVHLLQAGKRSLFAWKKHCRFPQKRIAAHIRTQCVQFCKYAVSPQSEFSHYEITFALSCVWRALQVLSSVPGSPWLCCWFQMWF